MYCCEAVRQLETVDEDCRYFYADKKEQVGRAANCRQRDANFGYHHGQNLANGNSPSNMAKSQQYELILTARPAPINTRHQNFNCEDFYLNDNTSDFRLRSVANCLAHLLQEPNNIREGDEKFHTSCGGPVQQLGMIEQRDSFIRDRFKLKKMMNIHSILLRTSPIEAQANDSSWIRSFMMKRIKSLDKARRQVLKLIENLNGYCDSIDLLRCILRTDHIAQVMMAFDEIINKAAAQLRAQKKLTTNGLLNPSGGLESSKVEFRIVREWTV